MEIEGETQTLKNVQLCVTIFSFSVSWILKLQLKLTCFLIIYINYISYKKCQEHFSKIYVSIQISNDTLLKFSIKVIYYMQAKVLQ